LNSERRLRYLFLDFNAYFASVEQQERPELRGKPVAIAPVMSDTTSCIAASYEAKAYGIRCGTNIGEARDRCKDLHVIAARPRVYVAYHEKAKQVAERVLPVDEVHSIDEISFKLLGEERNKAVACELAMKMKRELARALGPCIRCSIGVAPNRFLAKVATDMQKPDGLVVLESKDLPHKLHRLGLTEFVGINVRMEKRLNGALIFTAEQLCAASRRDLVQAFGSIVGEKWWYMLRGYDMGPEVHSRRSLGHSCVLAPDMRHDAACKEVLLRLLQKASARLRAEDLWTDAMDVDVTSPVRGWQSHIKLPPTQDTVTLNEFFLSAWESRNFTQPRKVGVTFTSLRKAEHVTPSLFDPNYDRMLLNRAVDTVNQKFGKNTIYLAGMAHARDAADEKIAFNKTWLFQEGKGDNAIVDLPDLNDPVQPPYRL
jgi:DNA polymerase-4